MIPDAVVDAIKLIVAAGIFVVIVQNPKLITAAIKLITDTLTGVLKLGG